MASAAQPIVTARSSVRSVAATATKAVAERFGLSEGRVSQLRRKFERLWRVFQGEAEVSCLMNASRFTGPIEIRCGG